MKKNRFSPEQISRILQECEAGAKCAELRRKHGMSDTAFHAWKAKCGNHSVSEARWLKSLEEENSKLERIVADQAVDIVGCKELPSRNGQRPPPSARPLPA